MRWRRAAAGARSSLVLLALCTLLACTPPNTELDLVWVTCGADATTSLTVHYLSRTPVASVVEVAADPAGPGARSFRVEGEGEPVPELFDHYVHHVPLTGLEPGRTYRLSVGRSGRERRVRTLPEAARLRLAVGGDMGTGPEASRLVALAASASPDALLVGGDLAYANGLETYAGRWLAWLRMISDQLVTPEGLTVPLVVAIGNHEVNRGRPGGSEAGDPDRKASPFWIPLFRQDESSYFRRRLGRDTVLYVLDSGHLRPHGGAQAEWLEEQLRADAGIGHRFALYHVPLYPAHRPYAGPDSVAGRRAWEPIFSRYRLTAAFENHDHVMKRSKPIRDGEVAPDGQGVLYLGDGSFGREPRTLEPEPRWYIERWASIRHFWLVDVLPEGVEYRDVDAAGRVVDMVPDGGREAGETLTRHRAPLPSQIDLPACHSAPPP